MWYKLVLGFEESIFKLVPTGFDIRELVDVFQFFRDQFINLLSVCLFPVVNDVLGFWLFLDTEVEVTASVEVAIH